jgi:integrase
MSKAKRGHFGCEEYKKRLSVTVPRQYSSTGSQKRISLKMDDTPENRAEAQRILKRIHAHIEIGDYDPEKLEEYIFGKPEKTAKTPLSTPKKEPSLDELWSRYVAQKSKNWSQTYIKNIISTVGSHINKLTTKQLSDALQIESELSHLSSEARYRTLTFISACCNWAVHSQIILHNPFWAIVDGLKAPHSDKDPDPFTRKEIERIIESYENHRRYSYLAPLVKFLHLTGCRTGEAVGLRWKNVTDKYIIFCESISMAGGKHIHREGTKTVDRREFPRKNPSLNQLLEQLKPENVNPDDFVFQEPSGGHIHRKRFYYSWYGIKIKEKFHKGIVSKLASKTEEEGGIDHYRCPYSTRHTFITLSLETKAEKRRLGPSDVSQIAKYVGNSAATIYKHYLGRSGNEELVNIDINSPPPQTSENGQPSYNELLAKLAVAEQRIAELSERQTLTPSVHEPTPVEPTSMPESPSSEPSETVSSLLANNKALSQRKSKTEPSEFELKQLSLFEVLTEMVNLHGE